MTPAAVSRTEWPAGRTGFEIAPFGYRFDDGEPGCHDSPATALRL